MDFPTKAEFRAWLKSLKPSDCVGIACRLGDCPLASYLNDHGAAGSAYVRPDRFVEESCWRISDDGSGRQTLPPWANEFGIYVDTGFGDGEALSARQALGVLNEVTYD
jgi:hypothetical protein